MIKRISIIIDNYLQMFIFILRLIKSMGDVNNTRLDSLKNISQEDCVILGNGPSLEQSMSENIHLLKNKTNICMGDFAITEYYEKIMPKLYLFIDPVHYSTKLSPQ